MVVGKLRALVVQESLSGTDLEAIICLEPMGAAKEGIHTEIVCARPIHTFELRIYIMVDKNSKVFQRCFYLYCM